MIYLLCFCLFVIGFFIGGFFFGIIVYKGFKSDIIDYLDRFENRVDYTFEHYFGESLFPKKN